MTASRTILLIAWLVSNTLLCAQSVHYSEEIKFSIRSGDTKIIGKSRGLVYVHVVSKAGSEIIAYRPNMTQHLSKVIPLQNESQKADQIFLRDSFFIVMHSAVERNVKSIGAKRFYLDVTPDSPEVLIDTFVRSVLSSMPQYRFTESNDRSKLLAYYTRSQGDGELLSFAVLNNDLQILHRDQVAIPSDGKRTRLQDAHVSDAGEVIVVITEYVDGSTTASKRFSILRSGDRFASNEQFSAEPEARWLNNLMFKVDDHNGNIVAAGFFSTDPRRMQSAEGVYFGVFSLATGRRASENFLAFAPEFIAKIKGTRQSRLTDRLYTFILDEIILRHDGGVVIVAESYLKSVRPRSSPTITDPYGPYTFGETSTTYYFEELLVMSLTPTGEVHWKNILIKSQVSSGDNGRFSSYITMNTGSRICFIFNDEVRYRTNVIQYIVYPEGDLDREIIFNSRKYDLYLMPQLGKQVSAREMVIPSYKRGKLRFVKMDY